MIHVQCTTAHLHYPAAYVPKNAAHMPGSCFTLQHNNAHLQQNN
ncbi:hypothetical protein FLA_3366 [Filimonas lacunae]|nr:hypothetical protein FLA_3366 [Filimonas lacunae]